MPGNRVRIRPQPINSIRPALRLAVPAMMLQFIEQAGIERSSVTGGDVLAHMLRVAHADDGGADRGMRQNKAQRHFRKRHSRGKDFFELVNAPNRVRQILWSEVESAPIVFWEAGFKSHLAAEAAFVERHARDHPNIELLA